jgi:class I fructose-bisphosphate aldolase
MKVTRKVKKILSYYEGEVPGVKANLARMLMQGKLGGTGKMVILPVDQGFEHGPDASFAPNPDAYDPEYHIKLAVDAGLSAYASVYGMLSAVSDSYAGQIPTILKVNSSNLLYKGAKPDQAIHGSVKDALRLGCSAIGFTIYPGSDSSFDMFEEIRDMAEEARAHGLAVVIWSYARGGGITKQGETAIDIISYSAHIAALLGAHIIKVKPPTSFIEKEKHKDLFKAVKTDTLADRIAHIKKASFDNKRLVVFSGGASKDEAGLLEDVKGIRDGGGNGSIIGRNTFQRPREEALELLQKITNVYLGKD